MRAVTVLTATAHGQQRGGVRKLTRPLPATPGPPEQSPGGVHRAESPVAVIEPVDALVVSREQERPRECVVTGAVAQRVHAHGQCDVPARLEVRRWVSDPRAGQQGGAYQGDQVGPDHRSVAHFMLKLMIDGERHHRHGEGAVVPARWQASATTAQEHSRAEEV